MNIDVKIGTGRGQCKVSIDGRDVSSRLTEISIHKSATTIPEITMKFIPDECNINIDASFITIDKKLCNYSIDELSEEIMKKLSHSISSSILNV